MPNPSLSTSAKPCPPVRLTYSPRTLPSAERELWENFESTLIREHSVISNLNRRIKAAEDGTSRCHRELDSITQRVSTMENVQKTSPPKHPTPGPTDPTATPLGQSAEPSPLVPKLEHKVRKLTQSLQETRLFANGLHTLIIQLQGTVTSLQLSRPTTDPLPVPPRTSHRPKRSELASRPSSSKKVRRSTPIHPPPSQPSSQAEEALDVLASPNRINSKKESSNSSSSSSSSSSEGEEGGYVTDLVPLQ
jgi:uncharacterized coiled-coil protein SlyX